MNGVTAGGVNFDTPEARAALTDRPNGAFWQVVTWTPLTLSPSIGCRECGHHGYITNGEWNPV